MCDGSSVMLHVRCGGCSKLYQQSAFIPGSASDGDELMEYPEIRNMGFECPKCQAPFAEIVAFKIVPKTKAA